MCISTAVAAAFTRLATKSGPQKLHLNLNTQQLSRISIKIKSAKVNIKIVLIKNFKEFRFKTFKALRSLLLVSPLHGFSRFPSSEASEPGELGTA